MLSHLFLHYTKSSLVLKFCGNEGCASSSWGPPKPPGPWIAQRRHQCSRIWHGSGRFAGDLCGSRRSRQTWTILSSKHLHKRSSAQNPWINPSLGCTKWSRATSRYFLSSSSLVTQITVKLNCCIQKSRLLPLQWTLWYMSLSALWFSQAIW